MFRFPRDGLRTRLVLAPFINITNYTRTHEQYKQRVKDNSQYVYTLPITHPTMWLLRRGGIPNGGQYGRQRGEQCGPEGGCLAHQLLGQLYQPVATQREFSMNVTMSCRSLHRLRKECYNNITVSRLIFNESVTSLQNNKSRVYSGLRQGDNQLMVRCFCT